MPPRATERRATTERATPRALQRAFRQCDRFLAGDGPRTSASLLAQIPADTEIDRYGHGGVVAELEGEVAALLGKEAALFLPTGTMAQQATLRVHAERRGRTAVAFHPACHLESHEERAYQRLHGLFGIPVGSRHAPLTLAALRDGVAEPLAALVLELPQRDLGGTLPTFRELSAQVAWARERGAAVHLDGARLWEAAPYYARSARQSMADVAALFDTVYVSFYKGLGGIAGCCVAGDRDVIDELSVWRTRHGGRAFMLWPYAASALTVLRTRPSDMDRYWRHARRIADALRGTARLDVLPDEVRTPMMHLRIADTTDAIAARALDIARRDRVATFVGPFTSVGTRLQEFEFQVGAATMAFTPEEVASIVARLAGAPRRRARPG